MRMKSGILGLFGLAVVVSTGIAVQVDRDPFQGGGKNENPFQTRVDRERNKIRDERANQELRVRLETEQADKQSLLRKLKQNEAEYRARLNQADAMVDELKARVRQLQNGMAVLEKRSEMESARSRFMDQVMEDVLVPLLNSDEDSQQLKGLKHLEQFVVTGERSEQRYMPNSVRILARLSHLVESENPAVHKKSVSLLQQFKPVLAAELGFQFPSPRWSAVNPDAFESRISRALDRQVDFEFDETLLTDIIEEIEAAHAIEFRVDPAVKTGKFVTFSTRASTLRQALSALLDENELGFNIVDNQIVVAKRDDPSIVLPRTYNVRGLLTPEFGIDSVVELVSRNKGDSKQVQKLDRHRIIVLGDAKQHESVARALAVLSR